MKFKSLSELTRELNTLISGEEIKFTLDQLESANQLARDISERLIVLRHKAYEKFVMPENRDISDTENHENVESIESEKSETLDDSETEIVTPFFQMSLIDAIEEAAAVIQENHVVEEEEAASSEVVSEDIHHSFEEQVVSNLEEAPQFSTAAADEAVQGKSEDTMQNFNTSVSQPVSPPISLADKHQFEKIDDLKRAITLNQRFQFSRELFKGNNQEYEVAIDRLNNSTREEALLMLRDLRAKFDWHEESSAALDFYGLVERRYSSL